MEEEDGRKVRSKEGKKQGRKEARKERRKERRKEERKKLWLEGRKKITIRILTTSGDDLSARSNPRASDASSDEFNASISTSPDGAPSSSAASAAAAAASSRSGAGDISRESTESPSPRNYSSVEGTPRSGSPGTMDVIHLYYPMVLDG